MPEPSIWDQQVLGPESIRLDQRVSFVTGAAQGIGEATALALARFGAHVAVCDRNESALADTRRQIASLGGECLEGVFDVRDEDAVVDFSKRVGARFGRIDVLVNNAGGGFHADFLDVSAKGENALVRENFGSVTAFVRASVPWMKQGGAIVNVTSVEAHRAGPGFAIYSAMKAAVANLTRSLALELAPRRIRINCVAPDMIPTPGDAALAQSSAAQGLAEVEPQPWLETGSVHDCAAAIVFLASDLARFVTGTTLHVDGGTHAAGGWKRRRDGKGFLL